MSAARYALASLALSIGGLLVSFAGWAGVLRGVVQLQASAVPNRRAALCVIGGALACMVGIGVAAASPLFGGLHSEQRVHVDQGEHVYEHRPADGDVPERPTQGVKRILGDSPLRIGFQGVEQGVARRDEGRFPAERCHQRHAGEKRVVFGYEGRFTARASARR